LSYVDIQTPPGQSGRVQFTFVEAGELEGKTFAVKVD